MRTCVTMTRLAVAGSVAVALSAAFSPAVGQDAGASSQDTLQTRPIRLLMVELGQDMNRINDGLWHEDYRMIRQGASAIADHPRITANEMAAIKSALTERFEAFVEIDRHVHQTAVTMANAADGKDLAAIMEAYSTLQRACVSCHAAFRDEVRAALY